MPNENCLLGMKCPKCGNEEPFAIAATCWAEVNDDGIDGAEDYEWHDTSTCICRRCTYTAKVADFKAKGKK
jgi:hypothetical protein